MAVARSAGPGRAAKELSVDQSTIFRRLKRIEENLGTRLFERHKSGYVLTTAGSSMMEHSEKIEQQMEYLNLSLAAQDIRPEGLIRFTTTPSTAELLIAPHLHRFQKDYPGIQISFNITAREFDLSRYQADMAVRATLQPPEHLVGRRLMTYRWQLHGNPDYLERYGHPKSVDDLLQHRILLPNEELGRIRMMRKLRSHLEPEPGHRLASNNLHLLYTLACKGLGLAFLPEYFATTTQELESIDLPDIESESQLWLLMHPEMAGLSRIRAFTNFLKEIFK